MWTHSGELVCKYVFHTVGPRCKKNQLDIEKESKQLARCVQTLLQLMIDKKCKSMCLSAISTDIFNFPLNNLVEIYQNTIKEFIKDYQEEMERKEIILCMCTTLMFFNPLVLLFCLF